MGCVKSVEQVIFSFGTGDTSLSTDLTKGQVQAQCAPLFLTAKGAITASGGQSQLAFEIYDNSGTPALRATRGVSGTTLTASIYVVEFISDISVQMNSFTAYTGDDHNISCTSVTKAYSFGHAYISTTSTEDDSNDLSWAFILSPTYLRLYRYSTGTGTTAGFTYVIEDTTGGTHFNVQHVSASSASSDFSTAAFTAVDMSKTFVLSSHYSQGSVFQSYNFGQVSLDTTTTVRVRGAGTTNYYMYAQVVELQADDVQVVRGDYASSSTWTTGNISLGVTFLENCAAHYSMSQDYFSTKVSTNSSASVAAQRIYIEIDPQKDGVDCSRSHTSFGTITTHFTWEAVDFGLAISRRIFIT